MGTHPIFESDFDCLTECPPSHLSFAPGVTLPSAPATFMARRAMPSSSQSVPPSASAKSNCATPSWTPRSRPAASPWRSTPRILIFSAPPRNKYHHHFKTKNKMDIIHSISFSNFRYPHYLLVHE